MYYFKSKTNEILLTPLTDIHNLKEGEDLICGLQQGHNEELIVCESFNDIGELYKRSFKNNQIKIKWYKCKKVHFFDYE